MIPNDRCDTSFSIKFETKPGQNVCIMGSIPELGNWSTCKAKLRWTEGHIWKCTLLLPQQFFEYKYVVYSTNDNKMIWEGGKNRMCNLEGLTSITFYDIWECFKIHFLLYYPLSEGTIMRINGNLEGMGKWNTHGPKNMNLTLNEITLPNGGQGKPWEFNIVVPNTTDIISYKYTTYNAKEDLAIWEREPTRELKIPDKVSYPELLKMKAEIDKSEATQIDLPVNGIIERFDVNFVSNINFDKIGTYPIFIGAYPQHEEDAKILAKNGITAVLNVQTDIDLKHRQIDIVKLEEVFARYKIKLVHYPIHDFNAEDLAKKVRGGAKCIDELINEGRIVYVHCTAGMGRAPSTVIAYLVIYKKFDLTDAYDLVKENRKVVNPNIWSLKQALLETK